MATRLPSLRGIETFLCVAEVLNLRIASERLNVTVSAISHRIQVLEQDLGLQLFDRGHRRLALTDDGTALLERLRPGVQLLQDATMMTRAKAARPLLRIAAPPLLNGWFLPRLGGFHALHPGVRLELLSSGRRRSASVDVSILPLTAVSQREGAQPLVNISISPVCSPAFLAENPVATPADLLKLPLIDTIPSFRGWNEWFLAAGVDEDVPAPALALDNQALVYPAVIDGSGVAIGMRNLVAEYLAGGLLVEPFPIVCEFAAPLGILVNENGNVRLARAFSAWLAEQFAQSAAILSTVAAKKATPGRRHSR